MNCAFNFRKCRVAVFSSRFCTKQCSAKCRQSLTFGCICHKSLFLHLSQIPFLYLSQISSPTSTLTSTLIQDQTACTYDHLMKPSQVLWLQKYLLEWVDLSLLGLSKVFRIKTNRLSGVAWTRFENSVRLSFLAVSWMVVSRVFLFKINRPWGVMWRRFQNLIKSFMLGFHVFFSEFSLPRQMDSVVSWVENFSRNQDFQILSNYPSSAARACAEFSWYG